MNRAWLVARREYIENLKTKGFWLNILSVPIVMMLIAGGITVIELTKTVKHYGVVDETGVLLDALEQQIDARDFRHLMRDPRPDAQLLLPVFMRPIFTRLKALSGAERSQVIDYLFHGREFAGRENEGGGLAGGGLAGSEYDGAGIARRELARSLHVGGGLAGGEDDGGRLAGSKTYGGELAVREEAKGLDAELIQQLRQEAPRIRDWWRSLSVDDRGQLSARMSGHRFRRVQVNSIDVLNEQLRTGAIFAYFILGPETVSSGEGVRYVAKNQTDRGLENWFGDLVNQLVQEQRLAESALDRTLVNWVTDKIEFENVQLDEQGKTTEVQAEDIIRQWAPVVFVYLLWISILFSTQQLMTNTIEEKSNRLVEVLLSSISAVAIMSGKVIGIALTGFTVVTFWLLMAASLFLGLPALLGIDLPIDLASVLADPLFILSFIVYYLLGYLFFAALLAGLGSLCSDLKQANNLVAPIQIFMIMPLIMMIPIAEDPSSILARILSWFPPFTPFVMMNRAAAPPAAWEYLGTTLLLMASLLVIFWFAAKLFRVGILMTGKPPGIREIARLLSAPVSSYPSIGANRKYSEAS